MKCAICDKVYTGVFGDMSALPILTQFTFVTCAEKVLHVKTIGSFTFKIVALKIATDLRK